MIDEIKKKIFCISRLEHKFYACCLFTIFFSFFFLYLLIQVVIDIFMKMFHLNYLLWMSIMTCWCVFSLSWKNENKKYHKKSNINGFWIRLCISLVACYSIFTLCLSLYILQVSFLGVIWSAKTFLVFLLFAYTVIIHMHSPLGNVNFYFACFQGVCLITGEQDW